MNNLILKLQSGNKFISYTGRDGNNYEAWRGGSDWYYRLKGTNGMTRVPYNYITPNGIRFYNTTDRGPIAFRYEDLVISPNSLKSQTSLKAAPKTSLSSTNVVNNQQKRSVSSTSVQPKSSRNNTLVRKSNNGFSQAWNNARNQGLSEFTWNGSRYNTRKAGETDEQYNTYLNSFRKPIEDRTNLYDVKTIPDTSVMQNYNVSNNQELLNTLSSSVPKYRLEQPLPSLLTIINKPLSKFTFAKKGTKLVSRNPIERFLKGKILPTAPKAEDRYKNGYKYGYRADGSVYLFPNPLYTIADIKGVRTDYPFMSNLGEIKRTIFYAGDNPMDTVYTEIPNSVFPVKIKLRYANSKNKTLEYETLKRRFNTAWNLTK